MAAQCHFTTRLLSRPIVYQVSSNDFSSPFDLIWGVGEEDYGTTVDIEPFSIPQVGIQHYVVASGAYVSTSSPRAPQGERLRVGNALAQLRAVVSAIRGGSPLPFAAGLDEGQLARAIELQGSPADVEGWARQLASDVGELVD